MARITAPELEQFIVATVELTGRVIGAGAYGSVEEVEIPGAMVAAKKLHQQLVNLGSPQQVEKWVNDFVEECKLMSQLRHPHIVQFLGVCYLPGAQLPVLLMEKLQTNLDNLLQTSPNIPIDLKVHLLTGTGQGVVYLHSRTPPIAHRDLSAKNILVDNGLNAKIADLGVSRIVNIQPGQLAASMTQMPGTGVYMPPEAAQAEGVTRYNTSIDIFSFGVVSLFTLTQTFPKDLKPATYRNPSSSTLRIVGRSEIERREHYIIPMKAALGETHPLVQLTLACLEYEQKDRPSAMVVLRLLQEVGTTLPQNCTNTKLELIQQLALKEKEIQLLSEKKDCDDLNADNVQIKSLIAIDDASESSQESHSFEITNHDNIEELDDSYIQYEADFNASHLGIEKVTVYLGKSLGRGGFGEVYKIKLPNGFFAAKFFNENRIENYSKDLKRELEILRKCKHDNVVKYTDSCQIPEKSKAPVLIMELMDNTFENHYMESNPTLECTVRILKQVSKGLDYLHSACDSKESVIHRDLKASNVLLRQNTSVTGFTAKIADFGLSRFIEHMNLESVAPMTILLATRYYSAPELKEHAYNLKVDIFSFGHLALVSCTKEIIKWLPPARIGSVQSGYRALSEIDIREKHLDKLKGLEGDQYAGLHKLTVKCLECEHENRPTAAEIIEELSQILKRQPGDFSRCSNTGFVKYRSAISSVPETSSDSFGIN